MNANDIKEEVIVLDDDDIKPKEYFTFDSNYRHFLSTLEHSPSPVFSDDYVKSSSNVRPLKRKQMVTSSYPYKCGLCTFVSQHRFVIQNHYQMNHVTENQPIHTVILTRDTPEEIAPIPRFPTVPQLPIVAPVRKKVVHFNIEPRFLKKELFDCEKCDYSTYNLKDLQLHAKMHLVIFPYKCTLCDFAAHNTFTVFNHYQLNHLDGLNCTSDASFECHVCGYITDDKEVYNLHAFNCYIRKFCSVMNESTTNGESFYCSMCSFKASHNFILTNHIRMAHEFIDDSVKLETDMYDLNSKYIIKDEFIVAES